MMFSELSAGILERYRNASAPNATFEDLDRLAAAVPPGAMGLKVRGDAFHLDVGEFFLGRTSNHTMGHEVRSILEAVAYELKRHVSELTSGIIPKQVTSGGGAARSWLWQTIKSEVLGCLVVAAECPETASRGAALLALSALRGMPIETWVHDERYLRQSISR